MHPGTGASFRLRSRLVLCCFIVLAVLDALTAVEASTVTYVLTEDSQRLPSPQGYVFDRYLQVLGLSSPVAIAIDDDGYVYVVDDKLNQVLKVDSDGSIVMRLESAEGRRLGSPSGIHIDAEANLWVADTENERIIQFSFSNRGRYIKKIN